jgi:hypothetical protein
VPARVHLILLDDSPVASASGHTDSAPRFGGGFFFQGGLAGLYGNAISISRPAKHTAKMMQN